MPSSIRLKIAAITAAAILAATLIGAFASGWREAERRFATKIGELEGIAAALAVTVEPALARDDRHQVFNALRAIGRIPGVRSAEVRRPGGAVVASFGAHVVVSSGSIRGAASAPARWRFSLATHPVTTPIVSGGRNIGTLSLVADISDLDRAFLDSLTAALLTGLVAAGLGFALAMGLERLVTGPLRALSSAMRDVRTTGDFARPVQRTSRDEIGELVDDFNAMLGEIRERDAKLRRHSETLEQTVAERTRDLATAKAAAERANAAKSDFLATMSHEIRTPMNGMMVMAELLAARGLEPRLQRYADVIASSGRSLLAIINDILDFSKVESGRLDLERIPVDPAAIADDVARLFGERAASKGIDLAVVAAGNLPASVVGDPVRLTQILSNLVNNALKFTDSGSVAIELTVAGMSGEPSEPVARLRFAVTDTGVGIAEDKLGQIFEAFVQADSSTTRSYGGTGIGLAICQRLVEAMGGALRVTSEVGRGSCFSFEIDCQVLATSGPDELFATQEPERVLALLIEGGATRRAIEGAARAAALATVTLDPHDVDHVALSGAVAVVADIAWLAANPAWLAAVPRVVALERLGGSPLAFTRPATQAWMTIGRPLTSLDTRNLLRFVSGTDTLADGAGSEVRGTAPRRTYHGVRVLAADDSAVNREVLSEVLQRLGVEVISVDTGAAAIAAWETDHFDLVFMDGSMPVLDGFDACRTIRRGEAASGRPATPVIALTAHVVGHHAAAWRDAGMNDCVSKPFTLAAIERCLDRWVPREDLADTVVASDTPSEAPARATALPALIDEQILRGMAEMAGPTSALVDRVVALFAGHAPAAALRLKDAIAAGEITDTGREAHALKAMCWNVGAVRLATWLETVEQGAVHGALPGREESDDVLGAGLAATIADLEHLARALRDARVTALVRAPASA